MGIFDRFMSAIRVNNDDDYEDDYLDDNEDFDEEDEDEEYEEKPKKGFFNRFMSKRSKSEDEDDFDDPDDEEEDELDNEELYRNSRPAFTARKETSSSFENKYSSSQSSSSKVTHIHRRPGQPANMEVCVTKPTSMDDARYIVSTLLSGTTIVLNLEGIDVETGQRIIDFVSGACYAIEGSIQEVSNYIFVITPKDVEISGDIRDILHNTIPSMRNNF